MSYASARKPLSDGAVATRQHQAWPPAICVYSAQETLYSATLGVAISQGRYTRGKNHKRPVLRKILGGLDLEGVLIPADALHTQRPYQLLQEQRGDGPMSTM